jgi:hypothetical protein
MVSMMVSQNNSIDLLRFDVHSCEPNLELFAAKSLVDQNFSVTTFNERRITATSRAKVSER